MFPLTVSERATAPIKIRVFGYKHYSLLATFFKFGRFFKSILLISILAEFISFLFPILYTFPSLSFPLYPFLLFASSFLKLQQTINIFNTMCINSLYQADARFQIQSADYFQKMFLLSS